MGRIYEMPKGRDRTWRMVLVGALAALATACVSPRGGARVEPMPRPAADLTPTFVGGPAVRGIASASTRQDTGRAGSAEASRAPQPDSAGDSMATQAMASPVAPPVADVPPAPPPIAWDLDVEANAARTRVMHFVDIFSGRSRPSFERSLSRQTRFAGMIGDRLRAAGLPLDLTYLALIESGYDPHAYSKAAAVGMWQFMTRTAKGVGLRVDWWIDERRDPVRSTEGAIRLLSSLHDDYGSFFLAAAAYNGGSGRVTRGLTQFAARIEPFEGEDRYFALSDTRYLRPETRDYVPKMIAAALVAKQPERYGLRVNPMEPFTFDSVRAPGGAPLAAIALAAPAELDAIRDLNPHVLRGMIPAGDSLWVRVPPGAAEGFAARFAALDSADRASLGRVVSKKGESMASIARKHKLTAKQLNWFNPKVSRLKSGNLVPGQAILVPTVAIAVAARDVPNPAIERYSRRSRRPVSRATAGAASKPSAKVTAAAKAPAKVPAKAAGKAPVKAAGKAPAAAPARSPAKARARSATKAPATKRP